MGKIVFIVVLKKNKKEKIFDKLKKMLKILKND